MNIYVVKTDPDRDGPVYDCTYGVCVMASGPDEARAMAATQCGDEGEEEWLDAECEHVGAAFSDVPRILLVDMLDG